MKRGFKSLSLVLAMVFILSLLLTACGQTAQNPAGSTDGTASQASSTAAASTGLDISKEAKIIMYLIGDEQPDAPKVYEEVNKKLKADINATVEVKYLPWADWQQKYPLVFASGEDFDLIYTADWVFYTDQATKHGFMEVTQDMLQKNMPDYYKQIPSDFYDQLKVDGKIYMVPYLNKQVMGHSMVITRGDLREKYGLPEIKSLDDYENYLLAIAKNEKGIMPYQSGIDEFYKNLFYKQENNLMFLHVSPILFTTSLETGDGKVNFALDDPKFVDGIKRIRKLFEAGGWSKNVLALKTDAVEEFKAGKLGSLSGQAEAMIEWASATSTLHPEFKPEVNDIQSDKIHESSSAARSGMGINANSKNYERALMMLNLFGTRKDYFDLTTYGIEGVHYQAIGDNQMKTLPDGASRFPTKANCPWGWERKDFMRYPDIVSKDLIGLEQSWIDGGKTSTTPIVSFNFVDTNVKNEIAACTNIYNVRGKALLSGLLPNVDDETAKFKADLKKAGIEKIQAELQKQLTDYVNQFGK